jgi:ubiquinone/menaquinone biosynthesis C-methylase UbiE
MTKQSFAREINTSSFESRWRENNRIKDRLRYNSECARKNFLFALKKTKMSNKNKKVLDIGFGSGLMMFNFHNSCELYGTEFSEYGIEMCNNIAQKKKYKNHEFITPQESEVLPYEDNSFDIIVGSHVVEHVEKDKLFLSEMYRCLKKNGIMYIICPIDNLDSNELLSEDELINPLYLQKKHWHVRNYNENSFVDRFSHLPSSILFQRFDMKVWDWKTRLDLFREKLSSTIIGKPIDFLIKLILNLPLSTLPLSGLNILDSFFGKLGYKNRQCTIAVKKT